MKRLALIILPFIIIGLGCSHEKIMEMPKGDALKIKEYEKKIDVKPLEGAEAVPPATPEEAAKAKEEEKAKPPEKKKKKKVAEKKKKAKVTSTVHEPKIEDAEGFVARRPVVDPFKVGESTILNLSYFNIVAGQLSINVKPFVEVSGDKAYHFEVTAVSNSFFNRIYAVDDRASTYVNYENMTPYNLEITLKESKQLAETRTLFDWDKGKAHYWKKRITKEHGEEENKVDWDVKAFSQNIVSAAYYLRTFTFKVGKKLAIRVADEGKNIVFTGEVIRREHLETDIGKFWTWVIRPKIEVDGVFTPVGEILIWLTDDDRKFMVRAESKIKIGSLVAKVRQIVPGGDGKMPVQKEE